MKLMKLHNVDGLAKDIKQGIEIYLNVDAIVAVLPYAGEWEHVTVLTQAGPLHFWENLEQLSVLPTEPE